MTEYISHAHTPEELKLEVLSDLRRRIVFLDAYTRDVAKSATERARLARAIAELADVLHYWEQVRIARPKTKRELTRERKQESISGSGPLPHPSISISKDTKQ